MRNFFFSHPKKKRVSNSINYLTQKKTDIRPSNSIVMHCVLGQVTLSCKASVFSSGYKAVITDN